MRIELLPLALLSSFFYCFTEALVIPSFLGPRGILKARGASHASSLISSSTTLFFKNATRSNFDVDRDSNPLTQSDSSNSTAAAIKIVKPFVENDDSASDLNFAPFDDNCFPGRDENIRYACDPSVIFWRDFQNQDEEPTVQQNLRAMERIARKFNTGANRFSKASYFGRNLGRTAYFIMNAILGDIAFQNSKRTDETERITSSPQKGYLPMGMDGVIATRLLLEAFLCHEQEYFGWIAKGVYREPWDMNTLNHRQVNPIYAMTQTGRFIREAVGTLGRRARAKEEDKQVRFFKSHPGTKEHISKLYPDYYQTAFHYQGEGWMSTESANVYETSTETLFLGRQDSMQRTSLPPIVELSKQFASTNTKGKIANRPMRVLEIACGTGRFMTFVRDSLPLDTEYTALDLSPFYLEKSFDNDEYWRKMRARKDNTSISPATLVQAQAEALPFADNSFDAVVCVYLFHEIPRFIRAKAAAEMARVVAPGGTVVLTDSVQKGDRPSIDEGLPHFSKMNEPFYIDFINDDLGAHFEKEGLIPKTKIIRSTTKSLSFSKPGELSP